MESLVDRRMGRGAQAAMCAAAFVTALLAITPSVFGEPNRFDEGFIASGAMMILRGWLPIRDLFVIYGPGQYYTVAGLYHLFGEDLAVSRAMHALQMASWGAAATGIALTLTGGRVVSALLVGTAYSLVAAFANPNATYPAITAGLMLVAASWTFWRWLRSKSASWLYVTSMVLGVTSLYRWDFGVFGLISTCLGLALAHWDLRTLRSKAGTDLARLLGPFAGVLAVGFVPFVVAGGFERWLQEVPVFMIRDFARWREMDFIAPALGRMADAWAASDGYGVARAGLRLVFAVTPPVLVALTLARIARRSWPARGRLDAADVLAAVTAVLALCLFNQMRVRPTLWQGFPSFAVALPLIAYLTQSATAQASGRRPGARFGALMAATLLLVLLPLYLVQEGVRDSLAGRWMKAQLPRASGTHMPRWLDKKGQWKLYPALVDFVRSHSAPGEAIFSGVQDTTRLVLNDALLYFMVDRPSATRWVEMEPGLTNTEAGQLEVIRDLEAKRVRLVVLWGYVSNEPNATSRSNGIHLLDSYVRNHYSEVRRFGDHVVLLRSTPFPHAPDTPGRG